MEKKTLTYGDLKCRKQKMRNEGTIVTHMEEYIETINAIKDAELMLLRSITFDEAYGELVKPKKRIKVAIAIGITVAALVLALLLSGCHTVDGIGGDLKAWSSPYIQTQEK